MHFDLTDLRLMVRVADCNSLPRGARASLLPLRAAGTRLRNVRQHVGDAHDARQR